MTRLLGVVERARRRRGWALFVAILRILLAFALVPSGLKKVIGEPFTDPANEGAFHDFLDAFFATGAFYTFVGASQLLAATLLFSQRFATAGALLLLPILTVILIFCWSTQVWFTAGVVTLMWLGNVGLVVWDAHKWRAVFAADDRPAAAAPAFAPQVDVRLWGACGLAIFAFYLLVCAISGEIYRPRGMELHDPRFYVFPALVVFPVVTWIVDRRRFRRRAPAPPR